MSREFRSICWTIASVCLIPAGIAAQGFTPIHLNAGGPQYVDLQGVTWVPDYGFSPGTATFPTTATISGTLSPGVYQTLRFGTYFSYSLPVPNGTYTVNLRFAETYWTSAGQRMFDVLINNQRVLTDFDVFAQAGGANRAVDRAFPVTVSSGVVNIQFTGILDNAIINGIEVLPQSSTSTTQTNGTTVSGNQTGSNAATAVFVNCAGGQYTDPNGTTWSADFGYTGSTATYSTGASIANTTTPALYQKERYGANFKYTLPVVNGNYAVTLKFAEIYWSSPGMRVFSVTINNQAVLTNFDIFAQAGGSNRALDKTFMVAVNSGAIVIQFVASVDNGKIDAIDIVPQTSTTQVAPPVNTPVSTPVQLGVSPTFTSVTAGGKAQFTAAVTGTTNTGVQWSVTPPMGSISSAGLYTAPASLSAAQTVTVMATSVANPAITASAGVSIIAAPTGTPQPITSPTTTLSPSQVQLTPSQTQQFTLTGLSGTQNTGGSSINISWSISPSVGGISTSGLYTAPSSIAAAQTITVTATNASSAAKLGSATVSLVVPIPAAPTAVTATPGNAQVTLSWTGSSGATGYNVKRATQNGGPYTIIGNAVTGTTYVDSGLTNGTAYYYVVSALNATGESANSSQVSAQPAAPAAPSQPTAVLLPVEVFGPANTTVPVSFSIPSGSNLSGQLQLWLQIHDLKYQTEASVQVNGGAWMPINNSTVTLLGKGNAWGGIGGGLSTLQLTMNLPAGSIKTGQNTLTFQFNGTDGVTSGFRVLNLNVLAADGSQLIPQSSFTQDDPSTWQPPLNDSADIQAGQTLWKTAALNSPGFGSIQAKCGDCHTQDGRDLKYFNYSNLSIQTRAMFHGLTPQQGNQIASYIRSLNVPAPASARPWNPLYQPGPGLDSQPVTNWAAGAGLSAVLDNDSDMVQAMMPGGSTADWGMNAYLNQHEMPTNFPLLDWNRWLPMIHPLDAFGSTFANSGLPSGYLAARALLKPNDPVSYATYVSGFGPMYQWLSSQTAFFNQVEQPASSSAWNNPQYGQEIYSVALWLMVKNWEINQEFGLEGMAQVAFGPNAPSSRAWYSDQPFGSSPSFLKMPSPNPGIGNGTAAVFDYLAYAWYNTQLILNDGNGQGNAAWPIDWGYAIAFVGNNLTWDATINQPRMGTGGLMLEWLTKTLQSNSGPGIHDLSHSSPYSLVAFPAQVATWSELTSSQKVQAMNAWISNWLSAANTFTAQQLFTAPPGITPLASPTFSSSTPSFTGNLVSALPQLQFQGVSNNLLNQVASWASSVWPTFNWSSTLSQTCAAGNLGQVWCQ